MALFSSAAYKKQKEVTKTKKYLNENHKFYLNLFFFWRSFICSRTVISLNMNISFPGTIKIKFKLKTFHFIKKKVSVTINCNCKATHCSWEHQNQLHILKQIWKSISFFFLFFTINLFFYSLGHNSVVMDLIYVEVLHNFKQYSPYSPL